MNEKKEIVRTFHRIQVTRLLLSQNFVSPLIMSRLYLKENEGMSKSDLKGFQVHSLGLYLDWYKTNVQSYKTVCCY